MSRGRRNARNQVSMNLFPFLAVLICTMGSLIALLVVMVQQARVRAQTLTEQEPTASAEAPPDAWSDLVSKQAQWEERQRLAQEKQEQVEHFQWQASLLHQSYAQSVNQLAQRRLALSHLESHARALSETATKMQAEADAIARTANNHLVDQDEARREIAQLETNIAAANIEFAETRQKIAQQAQRGTHALIPYEGPNGTQRRPIYIECLPDRVVLQPEGVTLRGEDFREPLGVGNPLAAALRAKREFLLENGLIDDGDEPYPLLVVRPHAAASYSASRVAMKAWEAEFGYELVEADVKLDYRPANPQLTRVLEEVIAEARDRRRLIRIARLREQSRPREGLLRASPQGGFEPVGGGTSRLVGSSGRPGRAGGRGYPGNELGEDGSDLPFGPGGGYSGSGYDSVDPGTGPNGGDATEKFDGGGASRWDARAGNEPAGASATDSDPAGRFGPGAGDSLGDQVLGSTHGPLGNEFAGPSGNGPAGNPGNEVAGRPGNEAAGNRPHGSGQSPDAGGEAGTMGSGGGGGSQGPSPSMQTSAGSSPFSNSQCLADTRGVDWAVPDATVDAVGIKRPIRVICDAERLVLVPERGTPDLAQIFKHHGSLQGVIDPFVNSVRERLRSWGIAGRGIYWKPVLQVEVNDGATSNFEQLVRLLEESGIRVTRQL